MSARPDGMEYLECSFEYGIVAAFNFGPASGEGRITAGIYLRLAGSGAALSGFFNASGAASIAGLITIAAAFRVELGYDTGSGDAYGDATFEIDFTIAIVSYGFSVDVSYRQAGSPRESAPSSSSSSSLTQAAFNLLPGKVAFAAEYSDPLRVRNDSVAETDARAVRVLDPSVWRGYWAAFPLEAAECED